MNLDVVGDSHSRSERSDSIAMAPFLTERFKFVPATLLATAVVTYAFWLTNGTFHLVRWPSSGSDPNLLFNSMLEHMLHERFDVDPTIVGTEGFVRDGRVYADWGIIPALIRIPLLFFRGGLGLDVMSLSSLLAVATAATMKLSALPYID